MLYLLLIGTCIIAVKQFPSSLERFYQKIKAATVTPTIVSVVESQNIDGQSYMLHGNKRVIVPGVLRKEKIEYRITKIGALEDEGEMVRVLKPSRDRVQPTCLVANSCGGCQLLHQSYSSQLSFKQKTLIDAFNSRNCSTLVESVFPANFTQSYRNKAQYAMQRDSNGVISIGLYKKHTHTVVDTLRCEIQSDESNHVLRVVRSFLQQFPTVSIYDERTRQGSLRHLLIRYGFNSNELMVCIVSATREVAHLRQLVNLLSVVPHVTSLLLHHNPHPADYVLAQDTTTVVLHGRDHILDEIAGVRVRVSLHSFTQSNPAQARRLYETVLGLAQLSHQDTVYDLYCGIGIIGMFLAPHARRVLGVESSSSAVADAKLNKAMNNIANIDFVCEKAEVFLAQHPFEPNEVVVLNPPRKGCESVLLRDIASRGVRRIVYVSCNPQTLIRDAHTLAELRYTLDTVQPVDMFPHSVHLETVAAFNRQ